MWQEHFQRIGKTNNVTVITPLYKSIDLSVYNPKEIGKTNTNGISSTTAVFKEISLIILNMSL